MGFPGGSQVKSLSANTGDVGSNPGSGWSLGKGNGNPLQYSCLGDPMDRGAWQAVFHGVTKESDTTQQLKQHINTHKCIRVKEWKLNKGGCLANGIVPVSISWFWRCTMLNRLSARGAWEEGEAGGRGHGALCTSFCSLLLVYDYFKIKCSLKVSIYIHALFYFTAPVFVRDMSS